MYICSYLLLVEGLLPPSENSITVNNNNNNNNNIVVHNPVHIEEYEDKKLFFFQVINVRAVRYVCTQLGRSDLYCTDRYLSPPVSGDINS